MARQRSHSVEFKRQVAQEFLADAAMIYASSRGGQRRLTGLVEAVARSAGVVGAARWKGGSGNRGRPVWCEGSVLNAACRRRHWRESDRVIRPMKPGNAGGGKDPDFCRAFEDGEVKVIGESLQTPIRIRKSRNATISRGVLSFGKRWQRLGD